MRALITLEIEVADSDPQKEHLLQELRLGAAVAVAGRLAGELRNAPMTFHDV